MSLLILTGPAGAGKNTIAHAFAKKKSKCAVVDVDTVRWMVLQPHHAPWSGAEGEKQVELGIRNASALTKNFIQEGYDVVILDVVTDWSLNLYKQYLQGNDFKIVILLPEFEELKKRNRQRPTTKITEGRIATLYKEQEKFTGFDEKIDNTSLSAEDVAEKLIKL